MRILLTGGSGFLGRRLAERLAARHELTLLLRPQARREGLPAGAAIAVGDVTDGDSLRRAAQGAEAIVHAAALVKIMASAAEFERVNVGGLERVLAAAGTARILYVSSFIALGPSEAAPGGVLDESAEPRERRFINDYERTKTLADRAARAAIAAGAALSIVYPGVIYGPGEMTEGNLVVRHLLDLAHGRLPALLGRPERRWNYVHVEDVVTGIAAVTERAPAGSRYLLGGENVTSAEFYALAERLGGIRVPKLRMPHAVAVALGWAMRGAALATGGVPKLTPDLAEVYRHDWAYSSARAERDLGYAPRSLAEGLAETIAWLKESGRWR